MTIDAFIFPIPAKLASDPEVSDYFNHINRALSDLTTLRGAAIASVATTTIAAPVLASASANDTELETAINLLITRVAALSVAVNAILVQKRFDGDIKT